MKGIITNVLGELEIDPYNCKGKYEKWAQSVSKTDGSIHLHTFSGISPTASGLLTSYRSYGKE
jgi:hypothetical protein